MAALLAAVLVGAACSASDGAPAPGPAATQLPTTSEKAAEPVPATTTTTGAPTELLAALERLWSRTPPSSCLMVADGAEVLFERRPDAPVVPASAMKLVVATAALAQLGPDALVPGEEGAAGSTTVRDLVARALRDSDNEAARLLLRAMGDEGGSGPSPPDATDVVMATIEALELPAGGLRVVDATGHDRTNAVTCRLLVALLTDEPFAQELTEGLPVAGRSGTLHDRFLGTAAEGRIRAKTGSIRGVAALAGHAHGERELTFAYVVEGAAADAGAALQEELAAALVAEEGQ